MLVLVLSIVVVRSALAHCIERVRHSSRRTASEVPEPVGAPPWP